MMATFRRILSWLRRERQWAQLRREPGPAATYIVELKADRARRTERG